MLSSQPELHVLAHQWSKKIIINYKGYVFTYLDILDNLFLSVVPEAIVNPLSDELQWRLRSKCVLGGHVEIIHESEQLLASNWNIHTYRYKQQENGKSYMYSKFFFLFFFFRLFPAIVW